MQHTQHGKPLHRYHERNARERSFNVGDLVLHRIQDTKGMHKLSAPWEGLSSWRSLVQRPTAFSGPMAKASRTSGTSSTYVASILSRCVPK
jgi:hypothetical protein